MFHFKERNNSLLIIQSATLKLSTLLIALYIKLYVFNKNFVILYTGNT